MTIRGVITLQRLEGRLVNCRSPGRDINARTLAGACRQAVEHHRKKVRFFATVDLVNALEQEKALNKAGQLAERLLRLDLIILDELGYRSLIVTDNKKEQRGGETCPE